MESYVERWKREKEEARYRKDVSNNGRKRKARKDGETEGQQRQKAQTDRGVQGKQSEELRESEKYFPHYAGTEGRNAEGV